MVDEDRFKSTRVDREVSSEMVQLGGLSRPTTAASPLMLLLILAAGQASGSSMPQVRSRQPGTKLSCFACNTMEYANESENKCRFLQTLERAEADRGSEQHKHKTRSTEGHLESADKTDEGVGLVAQHGLGNHQQFLKRQDEVARRECAADEPYCMVRSVVRFEFVGDDIQSKFWMLERNCSRSCNNDCMLIGDRHRLRLCNSCCATPDCNLGSGVSGLPVGGGLTLVLSLALLLVLAVSHEN